MQFTVPSGESGFLACLIDSVADPIFVKDRDHRWVLFNAAFVTLLGRPREQLLGKSDYDFFPKAQADVFRRQDELVFKTGKENVNEEMLTDAKDTTHVLVTRKSLWVAPDGAKYVLGVIRDLTEIIGADDEVKIQQERLRRVQKLETFGSMAGGVAHDFNNILTAIQGCAGLLLESLPQDHPSRGEAEEIRRASERAAVLTGRLLSFGRRPSGMARPVELRVIVEDMREMLRRLLPPDVELIVRQPKKPCVIRVDPGLIEQVLLNLAINAGEALPRGGRVTIETAAAPKGGGELAGPCARLSVRDDGAGISDKIRARIFEPFFTTKERGSGLGLSTVFEAVRRSGGGLVVKSVPGKGAAFHVYWPLAPGKAAGNRPGAVPAPGEARGRALVVDDDDAVRRFLVRCLEREGYEVLSASEPAEALRIGDANEGLFDLLVIDIVMPSMRGPELAKRLRPGQPRAKVLFTSGRRREDCGLPEGGGDDFLSKPFTSGELIGKVSAAARRGADGPSPRVRPPGRARSRRKAS